MLLSLKYTQYRSNCPTTAHTFLVLVTTNVSMRNLFRKCVSFGTVYVSHSVVLFFR